MGESEAGDLGRETAGCSSGPDTEGEEDWESEPNGPNVEGERVGAAQEGILGSVVVVGLGGREGAVAILDSGEAGGADETVFEMVFGGGECVWAMERDGSSGRIRDGV